MRNRYDSVMLERLSDNLLHKRIRLTIDITRRLIEDEDPAPAEHSSRKAEELLLSLR
jgi:hypothetical protein